MSLRRFAMRPGCSRPRATLRESRASGSAAQAFSAASPLTSSRTRAATMARKSLRAMPGR